MFQPKIIATTKRNNNKTGFGWYFALNDVANGVFLGVKNIQMMNILRINQEEMEEDTSKEEHMQANQKFNEPNVRWW